MGYVGIVVAFIKDRIENPEPGYHVFNYVDKPDFDMTELASVIEKKMNISIPKIRIAFWIGMLGVIALIYWLKSQVKRKPFHL